MWDDLNKYLQQLPNFVWNLLLIIFAIVIGLLFKLLLSLLLRLTSSKEAFSLMRSIISRLALPINIFLPLLVLNLLQPEMRMRRSQFAVVDKTIEILLTIGLAFVLMSIIKIAEDYVLYKYDLSKPDNLRERKIRTQLQFIRRIAKGIIVLITVCIILLSFNNLRKLGAGLLTGVGISGIIAGFAAQRSLANLLAGFQIAFTQPIRIDDVLVVEGEWGRVEEITLTYVVVVIWDQRRLILPINYFIEKPFQNWTRIGSEILSGAMVYVDYTVPVEAIRQEFLRLVQDHPLWDKRVAVLQVTDLKERTVELRCLVSANNSAHSFDLRCFIRENLLSYIREQYPHSFPQTRVILSPQTEQKNHSG